MQICYCTKKDDDDDDGVGGCSDDDDDDEMKWLEQSERREHYLFEGKPTPWSTLSERHNNSIITII